MPRRTDLKRILLIGSGPIVIGQGCEFDYSGTQACKALKAEGLEVVLVNSNPATIMTDPEIAERTYREARKRPRRPGQPLRQVYAGGLRGERAHRLPDYRPPVVHAGRRGRRRRL